jgi:energy-coupling factor transport system ATP-binding protein
MQIVKDHAERVIRMADGKIIEDTRKETADSEQVNRGHIGGICA